MADIKVLVFLPYYLPGYTSGGPIRSISNLVRWLDDVDFKIITSHTDPRDPEAYQKVNENTWQQVGEAQVYYATPPQLRWRAISDLVNQTPHDVVYLNSLFNYSFTIKPLLLRKLGMIRSTPVVLAPRGELSPGALSLKKWKKSAYLRVARLARLYEGVIWQASSIHEKREIRKRFGTTGNVKVAPNLPEPLSEDESVMEPSRSKDTGDLKMVFLSRIVRKKNLDGALRILKEVSKRVEFDIYGPIEDSQYWAECRSIIERLPPNVRVTYNGAVEHHNVHSVLSNYDLFFFPTHGENYGHVIIEALSAGCPVLISDTTPWRNLASENIGWALPLNQTDRYQTVIELCAELDETELAELSASARRYAQQVTSNPGAVKKNRKLFAVAANKF